MRMTVPARSSGSSAGQDWVQNEHAETGKPDNRSDEDRSRRCSASQLVQQRLNGPAHVDHPVGVGMGVLWRRRVARSTRLGGHRLSAFGSPLRNTCVARQPFRFAPRSQPRDEDLSPGSPVPGRIPRPVVNASHASVIPQARSHPPRPRASPHHLADCPSRRSPLGGKARWQKRFVFPARRMRRGLQF